MNCARHMQVLDANRIATSVLAGIASQTSLRAAWRSLRVNSPRSLSPCDLIKNELCTNSPSRLNRMPCETQATTRRDKQTAPSAIRTKGGKHMTDDDFFMYAVACQSAELRGQKPPPPPTPTEPALLNTVTAAVISAPKLFVVTLERRGTELRVLPQKSATFELGGRDAYHVNTLWCELKSFVSRARVDEISLRAAQDSGQYPAKPAAYKIEAILQLIPKFTVNFVHTNSVGAWIRREDPELPEPWLPSMEARWRKQQMRAIEMAAYAIYNGHSPDDWGLGD
jgi:hypothetical protein